MQGQDSEVLLIAIPVFNEQDQIKPFMEQLNTALSSINMQWSVLFVDDGSVDETTDVIMELVNQTPTVELIKLSRNFGKEAALTAALDHAEGTAVIPMDVDLQHPPELISSMVAAWREGFDVVHVYCRSRNAETRLKRNSARLFYFLMKKFGDTELPANVGDFRLLDRKVVLSIRQMRERTRYMKGILSWPGFRTTSVSYDRPRRISGEPRQSLSKLIGLALDGFVSFTSIPLRIWAVIGAVMSLFAFCYMTWIILSTLIFGNPVPGYASIMTTILFIGGMQLFSIGILGEYLSRVFTEVKRRPIYVIDGERSTYE